MDEKIITIEKKISELNILINEFKSENQLLNQKQKRKIYNKKYYQQMKNK
jgi:hypothetical protein